MRAPFSLLGLCLLLAAACSSSSEAPAPSAPRVCAPLPRTMDASGVKLADSCGNTLQLLPRVRIAGAWISGEACRVEASELVCGIGQQGEARVSGEAPELTVTFRPSSSPTVIQGVGLGGVASLGGATAWLSNGFQSWSQSGVIALGAEPTPAELDKALSKRGDDEVLREGRELSWFLTYVGGGESSLFVGATTANMFRPWISVSGPAEHLGVSVNAGGGGEAVTVAPGASVSGEAFRLELGSDLAGAQARYGASLATRRKAVQAPADLGWNSWYDLWDAVNEAAVRDNAKLALAALSPVAAGRKLRITVDDGWQLQWGDWDPNPKFPSGLDGLAKDLGAQGFQMGVWLAPLLASEKSKVVIDHPTWFLKDAAYPHAKNGTMRVLDVTHPEAAAHLTATIQKIVKWGYGLLKIDFLFAGTYEDASRAQPMTGFAAYAKALSVIREAAGEGTVLIGVGAPPVPTIASTDGWRVGPDIALETSGVSWPYIPSQLRTLAARVPFCQATLCDADPILSRKLERSEVDAGGWVVALGGGALFLSDDLRKLPPDRSGQGWDEARARLALSEKPGVPLDLFPPTPPPFLSNVVLDIVTRKTNQLTPRLWATAEGRVAFNSTDEALTIAGVSVPPHTVVKVP